MLYQKLKQCGMENSKTPDQTYWTRIESRTPNTSMNWKHYSIKNSNQNQTIDCISQIRTQIPLLQMFSPKSNIDHIAQDSDLDSIFELFAHLCSVCMKHPLPLSLTVVAVAHRTRSVADRSTGPEEALTLPAINCSNISSDLVDG